MLERDCVPSTSTTLCARLSLSIMSTHLLNRDTPATAIPAGHGLSLPAGTEVYITQTLGGNVTVRTDAGLFRIASEHVDSISGYAAPKPDSTVPANADGAFSEQAVWDALKTCFDPEIPVNIVDLGLVYDMQFKPGKTGGSRVDVKMTLTAPGCGMGPAIAGDAQIKLLNLPGVEDATVEIVWDPPWHHSMITPEGKKILGLE